MGTPKDGTRRALARAIAALAVSDLAYRMLIREPIRRSLGIEARHA